MEIVKHFLKFGLNELNTVLAAQILGHNGSFSWSK